MSVLAARQLIKRFKQRTVVNGVSLRVESGEIVGLLGRNGAGKTTTFYMLVGLIGAEHGTITLDGNDITDYSIHARARLGIGYLPQEPSVFRKLNVADNVRAIIQVRNDLTKAQQRRLLAELLHELGIEHLAKNGAMSLSGGERRRVEIARALAMEPRFILLDEPFAGVDPIMVQEIQQIVRHLAARDIGVLITDHYAWEILDLSDRVYIINEGAVLAEGDREELLRNPQVKEFYLGDDSKARNRTAA